MPSEVDTVHIQGCVSQQSDSSFLEGPLYLLTLPPFIAAYNCNSELSPSGIMSLVILAK